MDCLIHNLLLVNVQFIDFDVHNWLIHCQLGACSFAAYGPLSSIFISHKLNRLCAIICQKHPQLDSRLPHHFETICKIVTKIGVWQFYDCGCCRLLSGGEAARGVTHLNLYLKACSPCPSSVETKPTRVGRSSIQFLRWICFTFTRSGMILCKYLHIPA